MTEKIQFVVMCTSLLLNFASLSAICYAFYKFVNKPRTNLEQRITECEVQIKDVKDSLRQGNDKFREQAKTNRAVFSVLLAFTNFEIAYCHNTGYKDNSDLVKAQNAINEYLTDFDSN